MGRKIREAILSDAVSYIEIKNQLPFNIDENKSTTGGFLLGTNLETYQFYIQQGYCYSALNQNKIIGFGVVFPNDLVKNSDLWQKRNQVNWNVEISNLENSNLAFIDQLAFLKGNSKSAILLAYNMINLAFKNGANYVITTSVNQPIKNLAAVPFIKAAGGILVGNIDEIYPIIGKIKSDIYLISSQSFLSTLPKLSFYNWLKQNEI